MKAELLGGGCAGGEGSIPSWGGPKFAAAWGSVPTEPGVARDFPDLCGKKLAEGKRAPARVSERLRALHLPVGFTVSIARLV